jgi:hypothetical protein
MLSLLLQIMLQQRVTATLSQHSSMFQLEITCMLMCNVMPVHVLLLLAAQRWLQVHALFKEQGGKLVDGYAPFCKHVFVPNFVGEPAARQPLTQHSSWYCLPAVLMPLTD